MVLLVWPPAEHLWIGRNRGPIRASQRCRSMANVGAERLLKIPGRHEARRHFPSGAAQTRIVSAARIRLDSWKSLRTFKGIICGDISEFESSMGSQPVRSPPLFAGGLSKSPRLRTIQRSPSVDIRRIFVPADRHRGGLQGRPADAPRWRISPSWIAIVVPGRTLQRTHRIGVTRFLAQADSTSAEIDVLGVVFIVEPRRKQPHDVHLRPAAVLC